MQSQSPTDPASAATRDGSTASSAGPKCAAWSRSVLRALIAIALLYTCHRAFVLRLEYYDGYQFLANARAMLGDPFAFDRLRPPMLSILELPAMLVVRASPPGSVVRIVLPHCLAALISIVSAAAVLRSFRKVFSRGFALFGVLLFVGGRYFVRYGAHVMADLLSAGAVVFTLSAYVAARERRSLGAYALAGMAFGIGLLTKLPLIGLGPALLAAETWYALRARELDWRRWFGLMFLGFVGAAVFLAVQAVDYVAVFGRPGLDIVSKTFGPAGLLAAAPIANAEGNEAWHDWGSMALVMLGPTLAFAAAGLAVAIRQRQDRDVPFITCVAILGGFIVFGIGHNEARYLLPVVPAILYFAVRAVEAATEALRRGASPPWALGLVGIALVSAVLAPGVRQAWLDRDPVFFSDLQRRAAVRLLESRRPPGRLVWGRAWHTFAPRDMALMAKDESFNTFHLAPFIIEYFVDAPVLMPGSLWRVSADDLPLDPFFEDGDALLYAARAVYQTNNFPPAGIPPVEIWQISRETLARDGNRFVSSTTPMSLELQTSPNGERALRAQGDLGRWSVLAVPAGGAAPRRLADVTFEAGRPVSLGPGSRDLEIDQLVMANVQREVLR